MSASETFEGWAVLELMGHRRLAGYLSEVQVGGAAFLRIDLPADLGPDPDAPDVTATQIYSPGAVYCITPCTEETARSVARLNRVAPVARWELPAAPLDLVDVEIADDTEDDLDREMADHFAERD